MTRFWKKGTDGAEAMDASDVALRVVLQVAEDQIEAALGNLADRGSQAEGEVVGAEATDRGLVVTFGDKYEPRTALLRRLNSLQRVGVGITDFAWLDAVTDPTDRWLRDEFARWEGPRDNGTGIDQVEVARRRLGRLTGQLIVDRLLTLVSVADMEQQRRRTIAHAAALAGFNTHTTEAGDALVGCSVALVRVAPHAAMSLLDAASSIAELRRFGIRTKIDEAPLLELIDHPNWRVNGSATQLVAALPPPRSDEIAGALVRVGRGLVGQTKATEIRAEQVVAALATAAVARVDVDDTLDALRSHVSSNVRVDATVVLARRRPERARRLWEPWLTSRSTNERTAAERMIATLGDERDVAEVVRIVKHRAKPSTGTTYWPPLAAEGLNFLVRHADTPDAAHALDHLRSNWDRHDDDLQRWIRLNHPELVPPPPTAP